MEIEMGCEKLRRECTEKDVRFGAFQYLHRECLKCKIFNLYLICFPLSNMINGVIVVECIKQIWKVCRLFVASIFYANSFEQTHTHEYEKRKYLFCNFSVCLANENSTDVNGHIRCFKWCFVCDGNLKFMYLQSDFINWIISLKRESETTTTTAKRQVKTLPTTNDDRPKYWSELKCIENCSAFIWHRTLCVCVCVCVSVRVKLAVSKHIHNVAFIIIIRIVYLENVLFRCEAQWSKYTVHTQYVYCMVCDVYHQCPVSERTLWSSWLWESVGRLVYSMWP